VDGGETTGSAAGASAYDVSAQSWRRAAELRAEAAKHIEDAAEANRKADYLEKRGHAFGVGADGEVATGRVLDGLRVEGWVVLNDVRWPGRQRANIDHIAVGPGGILVIDSKNWSGRVDVRDETLRQNGYRRESEVAAAADAALAVLALLPADLHGSVRPLICLTRDEWVNVRARDVDITSTASLPNFLRSLPPTLSAARAENAVRELQAGLSRPFQRLPAQKGSHATLRAKSSSRRGGRQRVQKAASQRAGSRRPSKKGQQDTLRAVVALAILSVVLFTPQSTRAAAIDWFSEHIGGVVADAVIPEPTTTTPTSPTPSAKPSPSSR
jgi:hypothetical protein